MQDHAGSVDHRPQRRALLRAQPVGHGSLDRTGDIGFGFPLCEPCTKRVRLDPQRGDDLASSELLFESQHGRALAQLLD